MITPTQKNSPVSRTNTNGAAAVKSALVKDLVEAQPNPYATRRSREGYWKTITMLQVASQLHNKEGEKVCF